MWWDSLLTICALQLARTVQNHPLEQKSLLCSIYTAPQTVFLLPVGRWKAEFIFLTLNTTRLSQETLLPPSVWRATLPLFFLAALFNTRELINFPKCYIQPWGHKQQLGNSSCANSYTWQQTTKPLPWVLPLPAGVTEALCEVTRGTLWLSAMRRMEGMCQVRIFNWRGRQAFSPSPWGGFCLS